MALLQFSCNCVISRCLNLNLCTRHQYKYMYHIAGCRLHHEFILLLCQVSSIRQSSRFVSGRLWVQVPHLAPPSRFTPGRHGSQRRSSLGYAEGNLSVKSVGEINSLDALFWSNPPDAKAMAEQRHTASKLFRLHLRAGNSPPCRVQSRLYGSLNTQHPA